MNFEISALDAGAHHKPATATYWPNSQTEETEMWEVNGKTYKTYAEAKKAALRLAKKHKRSFIVRRAT